MKAEATMLERAEAFAAGPPDPPSYAVFVAVRASMFDAWARYLADYPNPRHVRTELSCTSNVMQQLFDLQVSEQRKNGPAPYAPPYFNRR